jgi:hypothetical protein
VIEEKTTEKRTSTEDDLQWRTSSFSAQTNCVEMALAGDGRVAVRNSKGPLDVITYFTREEMAAWVEGVKAGEFDDLC